MKIVAAIEGEEEMKAGLIILTGGKSSRMGQNKALLPFGQQTGLEIIVNQLVGSFLDPILVTNEPDIYKPYGLKLVRDNYPGLGPLAGIEAGLKSSSYDWNLVVACDMPFVSPALAKKLLIYGEGYDAVVPTIKGTPHPLFAVYNKTALPVMRRNLEERSLRMIFVLSHMNTFFFEGEPSTIHEWESALFNMNHPYEYEEAKKKL